MKRYNPFQKKVSFLHHGHIGDIIAFLPVFHQLGGTNFVICDSGWGEPMTGYKYNSLKPLLESQGIEVNNSASGSVDYDLTNWRECYRDDISLMDAQARFIGAVDRHNGFFEINKPWIKVDPDPFTKNRIVFNRSHRYRNLKFPWEKILKHFGSRSVFIGTDKEHEDFCEIAGDIEYYKTESCLDVAKAIEGSDFFVGNQSSSFWIAAGLRKPLLQEVFTPAPNSIIPYEGAWYCRDGNIDFTKLEK
jgi:hypothetical protein